MPIRVPDTNRPEVLAEVQAAFDAYEAALLANNTTELDGWFWNDDRAVRYGLAECLYGHDKIAAWRAAAEPVPQTRTITRSVVTTFGSDYAVVDCEFTNDPTGTRRAVGRQSQTWVRFDVGWKIVTAHVSMGER